MYRRILVPLDGSTLSARVLPHAAALAEACGAGLVLLRVSVPLADIIAAEATAVGLTPAPAVDPTPIYSAEREAAESYLAAAADMLERKGLAVDVDLEEGRAADVIVERARDLRALIAALPTHGVPPRPDARPAVAGRARILPERARPAQGADQASARYLPGGTCRTSTP